MKGKSLLIIVGIIVILAVSLGGSYNKLAILDEDVKAAWAQVDNRLKERADLIPNLLETVKGYASHEREIIEDISEARTRYSNASTPQEFAEADAQFTNAVSALNIIVENYPDLKANQNFADFQTELTGTERRISTERMRYNDSVKEYNSTIRRFPTNLIAGIFNFEKKQYFEINQEDAEVPKVEF